MTSVLEINNLTKRFGKFEALSKLNRLYNKFG